MAIHGPSSIEQHPSSLSCPLAPLPVFHLLKDFGHYRGPSSNLVDRTEQSEKALSAPPTCMHTCECRIFTAFVEVHTVCNAGADFITIRRYCRQFQLGCCWDLFSVIWNYLSLSYSMYPVCISVSSPLPSSLSLRTVTCTVLYMYEELSSTRNRVGLRHRAFTRPTRASPPFISAKMIGSRGCAPPV